MNRYLSTPLILLLGAAAFNVAAQDRGYARERGDNEARVERGAGREGGQGRGASSGYAAEGDKRGQDTGSFTDVSPAREQRSDSGGYGGRQDPGVSGFGVQSARDGGGGGRQDPGVSGFGVQRGANAVNGGRQDPGVSGFGVQRGGGNYGNGGRQDPGVSGFGVQSNSRQDYRGDRGYGRGRDSHSDYNNAYGSHDYRRGLPRTDHRYDRHDDYRHDGYRNDGYRYNDYGHNNHGFHWSTPQWRVSWNHGWSGHRYRAQARYYYPRGYAHTSWSIGYRLPLVFLAASYFVDYDTYGLAPPPYGCRWLRVDGDLLLVDQASGEIVDILYDFYY